MTCGCYMRYATSRNVRLVCLPLRPDSFIVINQTPKQESRHPCISMLRQNGCNYAINQSNLQPISGQFVCRPRCNVQTNILLLLDLWAPQKYRVGKYKHSESSNNHILLKLYLYFIIFSRGTIILEFWSWKWIIFGNWKWEIHFIWPIGVNILFTL